MSYQDYIDFDLKITGEKDNFETIYCENIQQLERQYQIESDSYNLMFDKFGLDTSI